jgi:hypothetical protein
VAQRFGRAFLAGAKPDLQNRSGQTALMLAALSGHVRAVRALVDGGATIDTVNRKGETSLTYALVWHRWRVVVELIDRAYVTAIGGARLGC